ncbi:toll/interleukin-1 receptor domain-containing protein [Sulfurovum sp. NBC37-1]|uniref:toll/interleukin-1 receptor domain-containing protein n=1 Tax=Sulfurovum sp. (strain NBC37-1) TaxID=387093 RepID=UPI0001587B3F|nr:toll/interleukin-1 receptor domain-containing protein [Sulfurovum sp. NBC37-1]BAF73051.1 hypothetical protein SUN_2111 [Sulfurovum sp. NBC37-1]
MGNGSSTGTGGKLVRKLITCNKNDFYEQCYQFLIKFNPNTTKDKKLTSLFTKSDKGYCIYYCLGTDEKVLKIKDLEIDNDIKIILSEYGVIDKIIIIHQKELANKLLRKQLTRLIDHFQKNIKIKALSPRSFIDYMFQKMNQSLIEKISNIHNKYKQNHQMRLSEKNIYIEEVPYYLEKKDKGTNPKKYIENSFIKKMNSTAKTWTFIISEFGFGKTSLLLNLSSINNDNIYIYIPLIQLSNKAFDNEQTLAKEILEILLEEELRKEDDYDNIAITEFKRMLRTEKKIILLYDGLDEYHLAYQEYGLKQIFNCASSFGCNSVFTLRKEFRDERYGSFQDSLFVQNRPTYTELILEEWNDKIILEYILSLKNTLSRESQDTKNLEKFEQLVRDKKYHQEYGDIPKRPLFLKMLTDDIISGDIKIKNISELYESYLTRKFTLDREGSYISKRAARPLSKQGDVYEVTDYIFDLLAKISWEMTNVDGFNIVYGEYITEEEIKNLMHTDYGEINHIIELLLNSVLIPYDKRKRRNFKAKFAHKSFQEYFLAYYLIFVILKEKTININALTLKYSKGTMDFCKYMIINENIQDVIDDLYINLNFDINKDALLYRHASINAHQRVSEKDKLNIKTDNSEFDFFISHSSVDKFPFVDEFVSELKDLGFNVFYDRMNIKEAENIVQEINEGFIRLKYGVIAIISPNFIEGSWCNEELAIGYSLKIEKEKILIPILLNISLKEVKDTYPILRNIKMFDNYVSSKSIAIEITRYKHEISNNV